MKKRFWGYFKLLCWYRFPVLSERSNNIAPTAVYFVLSRGSLNRILSCFYSMCFHCLVFSNRFSVFTDFFVYQAIVGTGFIDFRAYTKSDFDAAKYSS